MIYLGLFSFVLESGNWDVLKETNHNQSVLIEHRGFSVCVCVCVCLCVCVIKLSND